MAREDEWVMRFFRVASMNGIVTVIWTLLILWPDLNMSKIIAGGWPGTWLFIGYVMWIIVGCVGMVLCGTVRYMVPKATGKTFSSTLTGLHLILTEVGAVGSTWLLGLAGFIGGKLITIDQQPVSVAHLNIVSYALPVEIFAGVATLGVLIGIIDILLAKPAK
jgi:heme/copper-type cytochrome/quinol oxidase subunit 1